MTIRPASSLPAFGPMPRAFAAVGFALLLVVATACSSEPADGKDATADALPPFEHGIAPAGLGVYGYVKACVALEAYDGDRTVRFLQQQGAGFAWTAETAEQGEPLRMQPSALATYLLYDRDRRFVFGELKGEGASATFALTGPTELDSEIDVLDEKFRSPAEWIVEVSARDAERYQLRHYATDRYLTLDGLTDNAQQAAIISLHPAQGCVDFPEMALDAEGTVEPRAWPDGDLWGIAEIHSHIFSDAGFGGGGLFHGAPFHRLGVQEALPDCTRSHGPEGKRDLMGFFYDGDVKFDMAALIPVVTKGQFDEFNHNTDGWPTFSHWPNGRKRSTHQVMYYRHLQRAYLAGLRLVVQHATGNSVMCALTVATGAQKTLYDCNDMVSVDHAIDRAYELQDYVDAQHGGPGKGWLRVVKSPVQAREVIGKGKLALVLGIEISNVLDCFLTPPPGFPKCDEALVKSKLDHYRERGVRVLFPVHKYDNGFSAGDGSNGVIELGNALNCGHDSNFVEDCPDISTAFDKGEVTFGGLNKPRDVYDSPAPHDLTGLYDNFLGTLSPFLGDLQKGPLKGDWCQKHGLTPMGKLLIQEMMKRGLMIDVAHLPRRSLVEAYEMLEKADYPATKTHGDSNKGKIYALGGLTGGRIGRCMDPKKPGKMMDGFNSLLAEAKANGAYPAEALSFDLNGFAGAPGPRFGPDSGCGKEQPKPMSYPFTSYDGKVTFQQPTLGQRQVDFDNEGMIHIGLLPEVIEEARRDGASDSDLEPLYRSAEAYVRMWERAEARAKTMQ
ncbi:MAG: membrane dipeptidase [Deltaproteobacteria bacterium]|nr:membrane dipeptidase [Deltaproteobacteria bacterium]